LCSSKLIGKENNAEKQYAKYWKDGEFSSLLAVAASAGSGLGL
jgi:hypothetical protein